MGLYRLTSERVLKMGEPPAHTCMVSSCSANTPTPIAAPVQKLERNALLIGIPKYPHGLRSIHLAIMAVATSTSITPRSSRRMFHQVQRNEQRSREIDCEKQPCLPVVNCAGGNEKQETHRHSQQQKAEPRLEFDLVHIG